MKTLFKLVLLFAILSITFGAFILGYERFIGDWAIVVGAMFTVIGLVILDRKVLKISK